MKKRRNSRRSETVRHLASAAMNGNLEVKLPGGGTLDTSKNRLCEKQFASSQDMYSFLYDVLHTKGLTRPEVGVFNPHPTDLREGYLFPKDAFLVQEGNTIKEADKKDLQEAFDSVYERTGAPAVQIIAGCNAGDTKRVNIMLFPQLMQMNRICISFVGGLTEQEIEKFFAK